MDHNQTPTEVDRPRGILTKSDREYLLGEASIEPQSDSERHVRRRIRERIRNAILDFTLIFENLEGRDRRQIFEGTDEPPLWDGAVDMLAFLYYHVNGNEINRTLTWPSAVVDVADSRVSPDTREDRNRQLTRTALVRAALFSGIQIDEITVFDDIQYRPSSSGGPNRLDQLLDAMEQYDVGMADLARLIRWFERNGRDPDEMGRVICQLVNDEEMPSEGD